MIKSLIYRGTDGVIVLAVFLTINDKKVQNIRFDTIYLKLWKKYSPPAYIDSIWWWWWGGLGWQGHFGHFGGTKNGTLGARIKILGALL